jgi:chromosome segregation ATPase
VLLKAQLSDVSSQFEAASARLVEATAAVESLSAAAEEAQKELVAKSQQIAQLQMSLSEAEEQLVSITAREARSLEAEARRCVTVVQMCASSRQSSLQERRGASFPRKD